MKNTKPSWNPRVSRHKIWRLYQNDAQGIRDEALVDDVGISLLLRVESCRTVSEAQAGSLRRGIAKDKYYGPARNRHD